MLDIHEITIGQYLEYLNLIEKLQPRYEELFGEQEEVTPVDLLTQYPEYVERVVCFWTGWENVKERDADLVLGIFASIARLTALPQPAALKAFEHEGEWYHAPEDLQQLKKHLPMGKITFGQALEALQIEKLLDGDSSRIPFVLACIFTRKGERVDDIDLTARAESFKALPLMTAWNAYFFLASSARNWLKAMERSSRETMMP